MEDEDYESYVPARRLQKIDILIVGLELARMASYAVTNTLESAVQLVAAHANYNVERQQFHEAAALEIETIIGEQE